MRRPTQTVTVGIALPLITSQASPSVQAGGTISDNATLSRGYFPTGTITMHLYGPGDTSCANQIGSSSQPVDSNRTYFGGGITATTPGVYRWQVTYSGDANNSPEGPTTCGDPNETVTVTPRPIASLQVRPATATITAASSQPYQVEGFDAAGNDLGDVTATTTLTIGPVPMAPVDRQLHGALAGPPYCTSATDGTATGMATLQVVAGPICDADLAPAATTAPAGAPQPFTAEGFDAYGNDLGDVTAATGFAIGPDGSCNANVCQAFVTGPHTVIATDGTAINTASLTVTTAATTVILNSDLPTAPLNQPVTLTAVVAPISPATGIPTGKVTYLDGSKTLGSASLIGGSASLTLSSLTLGTHSVTARYAGDPSYGAATSGPVVEVVVRRPVTVAITAPATGAYGHRHRAGRDGHRHHLGGAGRRRSGHLQSRRTGGQGRHRRHGRGRDRPDPDPSRRRPDAYGRRRCLRAPSRGRGQPTPHRHTTVGHAHPHGRSACDHRLGHLDIGSGAIVGSTHSGHGRGRRRESGPRDPPDLSGRRHFAGPSNPSRPAIARDACPGRVRHLRYVPHAWLRGLHRQGGDYGQQPVLPGRE